MALRTLRLGHAARSSGLLACRPAAVATDHVRWVETVVGPGAPNLALPFEQRGLPTTKSNYATETVFNTVASGTIEVRAAVCTPPCLCTCLQILPALVAEFCGRGCRRHAQKRLRSFVTP